MKETPKSDTVFILDFWGLWQNVFISPGIFQVLLSLDYRKQSEQAFFLKEAPMQKARKFLVFFIVITFISATLPSSIFAKSAFIEEEISTENMVADALIVRPLGICATVLGVGLFVISLPFSALGGNVKDAGEKLIVAPAKFTFTRPLGEF